MFRCCIVTGENMDSSKRQFLQQLGVLTAGASLVPLAQAKFPFSPERHEGSLQHRYAMLVDLRRCIGCGPVPSVAPLKTRRHRANFVPSSTSIKYRLKVSKASPTSCCRDYATIVIIPLRARLPGTGHFPTRRRHRGGRQHTLRWLRLLRAGLPL